MSVEINNREKLGFFENLLINNGKKVREFYDRQNMADYLSAWQFLPVIILHSKVNSTPKVLSILSADRSYVDKLHKSCKYCLIDRQAYFC